MPMWFRVFGAGEAEPDPAGLVEHVRGLFRDDVTVRFRGDDQGWFAAEVALPDPQENWRLDRYLAGEEGIRHLLNSWAAWAETVEDGDIRDRLLRHLVNTRQVFTFEVGIGDPDLVADIDRACHALCRFLARQTEGVYQADGRGFFAADGSVLLREQ